MEHISIQFNKFYHKCVLSDLYKKSRKLVFKHLKDTRTNGAFTIYKHEDYESLDELKQLLKLLNLDYAVKEDESGKISTKDISVKALLEHTEWVIQVGIWNGIELNFVTDEWERLKQQYKD